MVEQKSLSKNFSRDSFHFWVFGLAQKKFEQIFLLKILLKNFCSKTSFFAQRYFCSMKYFCSATCFFAQKHDIFFCSEKNVQKGRFSGRFCWTGLLDGLLDGLLNRISIFLLSDIFAIFAQRFAPALAGWLAGSSQLSWVSGSLLP